jgi:hypothetical protein
MNKILTTLFTLVLSMFLATAAPAGKIQIPEKYDLGKQLEQVHDFWRTRIIDWEAVDNQSLIIETSPGTYYLLILTVPSYSLPMDMNRIRITNSGSTIREGVDSVIVPTGGHMSDKVPIERIYKLKDREQMTAITKQLQGEKKGETGDTHKY